MEKRDIIWLIQIGFRFLCRMLLLHVHLPAKEFSRIPIYVYKQCKRKRNLISSDASRRFLRECQRSLRAADRAPRFGIRSPSLLNVIFHYWTFYLGSIAKWTTLNLQLCKILRRELMKLWNKATSSERRQIHHHRQGMKL